MNDAGHVSITVSLAGGRIVAVDVASVRPRNLASVFVGREPTEVPRLARRLFALCGTSQSVAAHHALRAAGARLDDLDRGSSIDSLVAERLAEHLRASAITFASVVPFRDEERIALPAVLAAVAVPRLDGDALVAALGRLGFARDPAPAGSWAARVLAHAEHLPAGSDTHVDPLTARDDADVLAALEDDDDFAAFPRLPGRVPQTGAAARAVANGIRVTRPVDRLAARFSEITAAMGHLCLTRRFGIDDLVTSGTTARGRGFAAVETPRGRLHHVVARDRGGRVARLKILAPTEWNFAAAGPCAAALRDAEVTHEPVADNISRLASTYDPCVECRVVIRDVHEDGKCREAARGRRAPHEEIA